MFGAIAGGIASALAGGAMSKLFGGGQKAASGGIRGDVLATDNNTVGMGDAGIKSAIQIGRASCRERVWIWVVAVALEQRPDGTSSSAMARERHVHARPLSASDTRNG